MMANFDRPDAAKDLTGDPKIWPHDVRPAGRHESRVGQRATDGQGVDRRAAHRIKRNSTKVDELTNGAIDLLQKFADTVDAARGAVTKLAEQVSDPRLQQSLVETLDLAKTTLARFNQIASDIHNLSGDPNVQNDLKTTVATVKETAEEGQKLVERIDTCWIDKDRRQRSAVRHWQAGVDHRLHGAHERPALPVRFNSAPHRGPGTPYLGLYDFAERYKLNAQYETQLGGYGAFRYGIYAGKLGAGWTWPSAANSTRFRLDMYNPNNLQLDARDFPDQRRLFVVPGRGQSFQADNSPHWGTTYKIVAVASDMWQPPFRSF